MYFSRGRNKIQNLHGLADMYDYYKSTVDSNKVYLIEYEVYSAIIKEFYKRLMDEILYGYEYHLPYRFGTMMIIKRKVNVHALTKFGIDWLESVKYKKVIYHLNSHSKSYVYRFKWHKGDSIIPNLYYYKFVAARANKRELAQIIKNKECDFFEE